MTPEAFEIETVFHEEQQRILERFDDVEVINFDYDFDKSGSFRAVVKAKLGDRVERFSRAGSSGKAALRQLFSSLRRVANKTHGRTLRRRKNRMEFDAVY